MPSPRTNEVASCVPSEGSAVAAAVGSGVGSTVAVGAGIAVAVGSGAGGSVAMEGGAVGAAIVAAGGGVGCGSGCCEQAARIAVMKMAMAAPHNIRSIR